MNGDSTSLYALTARQGATVLAALRLWQVSHPDNLSRDDIPAPFQNHFDEHSPLTAAEIDALCEHLNCNEVNTVHPTSWR